MLQEAPHPLVPAIRINTHSCDSYKALLQGNSYKAATKNSHCQCCIRPKDHSPLSHSESPDQAFQCTLSLPKTWQRSGSRSSSKIKDQDQRSGSKIRMKNQDFCAPGPKPDNDWSRPKVSWSGCPSVVNTTTNNH